MSNNILTVKKDSREFDKDICPCCVHRRDRVVLGFGQNFNTYYKLIYEVPYNLIHESSVVTKDRIAKQITFQI